MDITCPAALRDEVQRELAWRVTAMVAQGERVGLGERHPTLRARPDPLYGRWDCTSCGATGTGGDCPLCNAARVLALRALGRLPKPEPRQRPEAPSSAAPARALPQPETAPAVTIPTWTCRVCGRPVRGFRDRDDECGPCEYQRVTTTLDLSRLRGGGESEQAFQQSLRLAITQALPEVRVWRQPAGSIPALRGGYVDAAPVGAADLSGIVRPEGWRLEVEVKGAKTRETSDQQRWRAFILAAGGIALLVRDDGTPEAVAHGVEAIRAAITERRARG